MFLLSFWLTWRKGCYSMLELMYTHFKQTNTKDSRLMAPNHFLNVFSKIYLHMATHGYTCVNPVLVLFYTCVTPFFSGLHMCNSIFFRFTQCNSIFLGLHMATHGYTSTTHLRNLPRSLVVRPEVLPLSGREGLNVRHLIQISPSNRPFEHKTSQNVLLSTGFLYDYML